MRCYVGSRSIRADVPESPTPSDEGDRRLADGTCRVDDGLASLCQQGAARRDQHHVRLCGSLRQGLPARLLPQLVQPSTVGLS